MSQRTLLAAKINLDMLEYKGRKYAAPSPGERLRLLVRAIRSDAPSVSTKRSRIIRWRFANVTTLEGQYIFGRVCKVSDLVSERAPESQEPTVSVQPDTILAYSYFLFDPGSELLVYEQRSVIPPNTFLQVFRKICINAERNVGDIVITPILDRAKLRREIELFRTITVAEFGLVHANWIHDSAITALDEQLKRAMAREGSIKLKNSKGLALDAIVDDGLRMVEHGYGHVRFTGYDQQGKPKKYDSRMDIVSTRVELGDAQEVSSSTFVHFLHYVKEVISNDP